MTDNRFDKNRILLNKEKVYLFINTKSDGLFREIVIINVISFSKYKEWMLPTTGTTLYQNYHSFVAKLSNTSLFIKYTIEKNLFQE